MIAFALVAMLVCSLLRLSLLLLAAVSATAGFTTPGPSGRGNDYAAVSGMESVRGADGQPRRANSNRRFKLDFSEPRWASELTGGPTGYSVRPNASQTWGAWEGWGTSLSWWANVFGQRADLADLVFTLKDTHLGNDTLPGLGMTIARYNAGGSSFREAGGARMVASPNIPPWKQIQGFWQDWSDRSPTSGSWNWTADANQVSMARMARQRGATHIELFSNSPMWWACDNHNPSGNGDGSADNLQTWNYDQHAAYLATIVQYAESHFGFSFDSVEAFNEPISNWWHSTGEPSHVIYGGHGVSLFSRGLGGAIHVVNLCSYDLYCTPLPSSGPMPQAHKRAATLITRPKPV